VPNAAGVQVHSNTTGEIEGAYNLFEADNDNSVTKASGIGDLEACCGMPPLEIGNYVWCDSIQNGIQDPCEKEIVGLNVQLYDVAGTLVGETVTDANGNYYFNESNVDTTGINGAGSPLTGWSGINYDKKYYLVFGNGQFANNTFTLGADTYNGVTTNDVNGNGDDNIDSDVDGSVLTPALGAMPAGLPQICITSDRIGCGNHRYDLGLLCCPQETCFDITISRN